MVKYLLSSRKTQQVSHNFSQNQKINLHSYLFIEKRKRDIQTSMWLDTDYLVIGAGAASMAFVDTLLTESLDVSILIVDRHAHPGGHWNDAYGFVQLHQPSLLYGVASQQLEGNWFKQLVTKGKFPWQHRATKNEILAYYRSLMNKWVASGRVQYYPCSTYHFEQQQQSLDETVHVFTDERTQQVHYVRVREKRVNGVVGECRVPSQTPPNFLILPPQSDNVQVITPNQIYDRRSSSDAALLPQQQYVVLGAGKTVRGPHESFALFHEYVDF